MTTSTRRAGRPTLDDVARAAGVGRGTASRAVNGADGVSRRARAAVERAVDELGYVPHSVARSLATRRTGCVALVVSESEERVFAEPFFAAVVRGAGRALARAGLQLLLTTAADAGERARVERYLLGGHVDGAVLLSLHGDDELVDRLERSGLAVVVGGRPLSGRLRAWVDVDNRGGARQAVDHLLATGHRRVAVVAGPQDMSAGRERLAGARDALAAAGVPDDLVEQGDFGEESGAAALAALLDRDPGLDAVFAASDLMALGALRVLAQRGRRVPDDVAVVGFDDAPVSRLAAPPLTTVRQPVEQMGAALVDALLGVLAGGPGGEEVLPTELVLRASA